MMNKLKKVIMPFMLGAFLFGGVESTVKIIEPISVYAEETTEHGKIPDITMKDDGSGINVGDLTGQSEDVYSKALSEFRTAVIFISGIGTVCMILFFILNFINLGKSQGNPQERQKAISGLIITGIATAGLGSVTLIASLFYKML